ncbi:unnamed protein product, partial [Arctogadus glacialis]
LKPLSNISPRFHGRFEFLNSKKSLGFMRDMFFAIFCYEPMHSCDPNTYPML